MFKPTPPSHNRVLSQQAMIGRESPWLFKNNGRNSKSVNRSSDRIAVNRSSDRMLGNNRASDRNIGTANRSRDNSRKRSALKIGNARSIENLHPSRMKR